MPIYSLSKLLAPVITHENRLRTSLVLVRVDLTPLSHPPRGNWKETLQQCLEVVQRCVYLDKDLVLPPMGASGAAETFFVVASTDVPRSGIMTTRIREQLERLSDLTAKCKLTITTLPVELPPGHADATLDQQVQNVASSVTQMILTTRERQQPGTGKHAKKSN